MIRNIDYIFGILVTDGSIELSSRNRGKVRLEVKYEDRDIVYKLKERIDGSTVTERTRDTNFKKSYHSICFNNYRIEFRELLFGMGYPTENKSENECPPKTEYNKKEFWRGVFDGDGSIGCTKDGRPFVSLITVSDILHDEFTRFLKEELGIIRIINRNKRDNCYIFSLFDEDAIRFCEYIYSEADIYLERKYNEYMKFSSWKRTKKKVNRRTWTKEEDEFILKNTVKDSMKKLGRTEKSIQLRKFRLKKSVND